MMHKRPKMFRRIRSLDYSADILGYKQGLLHINGPEWNRIRKITSPSLSKPNVVSKVHYIRKIALNLVADLEEQLASRDNVLVEMDKTLLTYSFRVVCLAAFGAEELSDKHKEYFFGPQFPHDVSATLQFFVESSYFPFPKWVWRMTPFFRYESYAIECDARFTRVCHDIVDLRRKAQADAVKNKDIGMFDNNSLIDIMLTNEDHNQSNQTQSGPFVAGKVVVTDEEIVANVKIFFLGGSDTTSIAVTWALYYLTKDQLLLDALRVECAPLFDSSNNVLTASSESLYQQVSSKSMPLCHAVIRETLRLCSPAAVVVSEIESTTTPVVMSNGLIIYPHEEIFTYLDAILQDENTFIDATKFDPYRWILHEKDATQAAVQRLTLMESTFIPFGYGPRVCPGMGLALVEAVFAISAMVHHFDMELACPDKEIKRIFNFAALPNKMPILLSRRVFKS